jgi:hypothetical protein
MRHDWHIAFHSGMTSKSDLRAGVDEGVPVGVVATRLVIDQLIQVLPRYLDRGGKVFVDSGAFEAFQKGNLMDWSRVFFRYEALIVRTERPDCLSIVAPDVIADQEATLALWEAHAQRVRTWIDAGVRVIVPLQQGELTAAEMLARAKRIFERQNFSAGIPSNLAAMTADDCATLFHDDFHILGRVVMTDELSLKMRALIANNPLATFTADANWLRSRVAKVSAAAQAAERCKWGIVSRRTTALRQVLREEGYACTTGRVPAQRGLGAGVIGSSVSPGMRSNISICSAKNTT